MRRVESKSLFTHWGIFHSINKKPLTIFTMRRKIKKKMNKNIVCKWQFKLLFFIFIGTAIIPQITYAKFIIDDFESGGPVHLYVDQYKAYDKFSQDGLPVPSGRRELSIYNLYNPDGTVTKLDLINTLGDDSICVSGSQVSTYPGSRATIWYRNGYHGMSLDITSLGDRFYVIVNDDPGIDVSMSMALQDQDSAPGGFVGNLNGSGYYEIPFSIYYDNPSIDLTQISGFCLQMNFIGSQQEVAITEWGIIPELSTLLLLGTGAFILRKKR